MPEWYKKRILQRPRQETQSVTERPSETYQLELPDFKIPTVTNSEDSVMTGLENRKWRDIWEHKGRTSGINNTDAPLQQEHPSLFLLPFAPEVMGSGLGLGVLKTLGGYAGSYVGSKIGNEVGYALDNTFNKQLFEPLGEIVGGFSGFGKGYNLFEKAGMQGALKYLSQTGKEIPRWFMRPELRTNVGRVNRRTFFAEDQTPKYNSNQITGHFGKVKYYGPTMGKTTAVAANSRLVDFDDIIRQPSRTILDRYGFRNKSEMYNSGNQEAIKAYEDMLVKTLRDWRANPENSNLTLVASPTAIANPSNTGFYFDNVPSIPSRDVFITRNVGRGGTPEASALWYDSLIKQNPNLKIDDRFVSQIESKPYQSPSVSQLEIVPQAAYASEVPVITKQNVTSITDAQWDAAYNEAVKSGNIAEVQRLRDLHFAAKAPNTKIIDDTGMPKEVYHGTLGEKFTIFDSSKTRPDYNYGTSTNMFSDNKNVGLGYANNDPNKLHSVYLNLQNILERDFKGNAWNGSVDHSGKFQIVPEYGTTYSSQQEAEEALQKILDQYYPNNPAKQAEQRHYMYVMELMDPAHPEKSTNAFSDELVKNPTLDGGIVRNVKDYYDLPRMDEDPELYTELTAPHTDYFVKDSRNIKLSDPIAYDDSGQIIPLSKRDDFTNPDIRYDLPIFNGKPTVITSPKTRREILDKYKEKHLLFEELPEYEFKTNSGSYYRVGHFPITDDLRLHKKLIGQRLDNFANDWKSNWGYYRDPITHSANMYPAQKMLDKVGENGVTVVFPKDRDSQYAGWFSRSGPLMGESFVTANPWRIKPPRYTQLHESISHATDDLVRNITNKSRLSVIDAYKQVSEPQDLFPEYYKYFVNSGESYIPEEARAMNQEIIKRINEILSKKTGKSLEEVYNDSGLLNNFVDTNLSDNDNLLKFLDSFDSMYLSDYANLLRKNINTDAGKKYADRIRNMIKTLPAITGLGIIGLNNVPQKQE